MRNDAEQFKQRVKATFDLVASGYDNPSQRYFPFCADRMVHKLELKPGEKVLDIATGTGMAAIAAAQHILPEGRVHAIDIAKNMISKAQFNANKHALDNVNFQLMDATNLEFRANYFDVITCAFGLFFLPDIPAALSQWLRVLKPGGRLIFTSFTAQAFQPFTDLFRAHVEQLGISFPVATWQRLAEPQLCQQLMTQAGFTATTCDVEQMGYHLQSENDWWEILWNSGFRGIVNQLSAEQQAQIRVDHLAEIAQLKTDKGLWLNVEVIFSQAHKPRLLA